MDQTADQIRAQVRDSYGEVAKRQSGCCGGPSTHSQTLGYSADELTEVPADADLGLGCGNPGALAALQAGEVVVDLGAGAGLDALLAAKKVGDTGHVIGIDMTREMLARARKNAVEAGVAGHVEFREGLIEKLPIVSDSVDVVISNCVINLSPDKPAVFREAFRILKPGGRVAVSDILLSAPLPEAVKASAAAYVACVAGAEVADSYFASMRDAGFVDLEFSRTPARDMFASALADPMVQAAVQAFGEDRIEQVLGTVFSYKISARKPA